MKYMLMNNTFKTRILLLACVFCACNLFGQQSEQQSEKEIIIISKTVDENGNETEEKITLKGEEAEKYIREQGMQITETEKDGEREIEVKIDNTDGNVKKTVKVWIDDENETHTIEEGDEMILIEGDEIPADIIKKLEEHGITIDEGDQDQSEDKKAYKVISIDEDGNEKIIEWDGEGDMPEEMKRMKEEHGIHGHTVKKKKIIKIEEEKTINVKEGSKVIKIKKKKDGKETEEVIEIGENDELPDEVKQMLKENGIDLESLPEKGKVRIEIEQDKDGNQTRKEVEIEEIHEHHGDKDMHQNKAQLGVMIENSDNGVKVIELIKGGSAESSGILVNDIITKVDKVEVEDMDQLIDMLSDKNPGDQVKLTMIRDGKEVKQKLTMKAPQKKN